MNAPDNFQAIQRRKALYEWLADQKRRMALRFPKIDFDSNYWPIKTLYNTVQGDWYFTKAFSEFDGKDVSYFDALRCLVAEMAIVGKPKSIAWAIQPFRLLARAAPQTLFDLSVEAFRQIEAQCLIDARKNPAGADTIRTCLGQLGNRVFGQLATKGVTPRLSVILRPEVRGELNKIVKAHITQRGTGKGELLDRKMEAFNGAFNALVANPLDSDGKPVLSAMDREAICAMVILLCAPSRINEPLCMSIDDQITIDDYASATIGDRDILHNTHKLLLMKGSKGAEWSAKPVLLFMQDALHYCMSIVREQGKRSRMLVEWYGKNPTTLYLPPELEHLRGQALSTRQLAQIIHMTEYPTRNEIGGVRGKYIPVFKGRVFKAPDPDIFDISGRPKARSTINHVPWPDAETLLLTRVHEAMAACRRVTPHNHYEGNLSKMLFLFDRDQTHYLPYAINGKIIRERLKQTERDRSKDSPPPPTIFEKLNITMPVAGTIQIAELETHDPRRWLTTQALIHGEKLSNVLINKWANRLSLAQLKHYDKRFPEFKAAQSAMPEAPELTELTDFSNGLAAVEKLEDQFGLKAAIVTAHDVGIAMTSMDAVAQAVENRPVAKSSRGIIIIYPQRFGVCFHQHHEKPCRNYSNELSASCVTCNEGLFVKGHIPTNDEIRKIAEQLFGSILRHLENLAITHNRGIADDPAMLGEHMLTLVEKGLDRVTMVQLATHLIDNFHELNRLIKDRQLANRLHQAFVAREVVRKLNDQGVSSGALIKYHNPTQHAEPLLEVALDAHGGREQVARDEQALIAKHPQFAPKALGLTDQRHLIAPDDDEGED